jgi:hypothetical protein
VEDSIVSTCFSTMTEEVDSEEYMRLGFSSVTKRESNEENWK